MTAQPPHPGSTETQELLLDAFEAIDEGMAIYDANRRLVQFNSRYAEMLSPLEDLLVPGLAWEDLLHAGASRGRYAESGGQVADREGAGSAG